MVTGSCYLLEAGGMRILVDCGLFQGRDEDLNQDGFDFSPASLDAVVLTHAHIDHAGRLPLLVKMGFRGPIYTHPASAELAAIMLQDSAHIQESDAERTNRKAKRAGQGQKQPLYTMADARAVEGQLRPVPYGKLTELNEHLRIRLQDAGHILGSAIAEIFETDVAGRELKIVFSGDIGQPGRPILRDPTPILEADYLVMESTYGNKHHDAPADVREALAEIIRTTVAKGGNVIIPAFAVGRTQEILYELNALSEAGKLPRDLKVVLDSPLAIAATEVTARYSDIYDEEARKLVRRGDKPFQFPGLTHTLSAQESMALNVVKMPMVIVAASGMCEAGRVQHHLKHNLWKPTATILFVGFQAEGTLGRALLEGSRRVRIHGEEVAVRARIESLHGFSAHADQGQMLEWASHFRRAPVRTFLVHGEAAAQEELSVLLNGRGHRTVIPALGQSAVLSHDGVHLEAEPPMRVREREKPPTAKKVKAGVTVSKNAALALSARRMSALLRELRAVRKAWNVNGPHMAPEAAVDVAQRAEDVLRALEDMRRLIDRP